MNLGQEVSARLTHPHTVTHLYKARHPLVALPFAWLGYISVPEQALGWFPLGFVEDKLFMCKFHLLILVFD